MTKVEHEHLPRLEPGYYRGFAVVHWTMTIRDRRTGWHNGSSHACIREMLLHTSVKYDLLCPTYCLMPDHVHLIWMGVREKTDQLLAAQFFRRMTGDVISPHEWQREAYDHVLREDERKRGAFASACHYILENPVVAGLVATWVAYDFSGSCLPGYPDVDPRRADYWDVFWGIYTRHRETGTERAGGA